MTISQEQCGLRPWRGCVNQMFVLRQVAEKAREKGRKVFFQLGESI